MVWTCDPAAQVAAAFQQHRHPMQTHVGERPHRAAAVAQHHDRLMSNLAGDVVAWLRDGTGSSNTEPLAAEHVLDFQRQYVRRGVDGRRHRTRIVEADNGRRDAAGRDAPVVAGQRVLRRGHGGTPWRDGTIIGAFADRGIGRMTLAGRFPGTARRGTNARTGSRAHMVRTATENRMWIVRDAERGCRPIGLGMGARSSSAVLVRAIWPARFWCVACWFVRCLRTPAPVRNVGAAA